MSMIIASMPVGVIQWLQLGICILKVWLCCALFLAAFAAAVRQRE